MRKNTHLIKSSQVILSIKTDGNSFSDNLIVMVVKENGADLTRYAVIASKTVGGAVNRNRCKRRLRSRMSKHLLNIKKGYDILLIARKKLAAAKPHQVDSSLQELLTSAGLI